MTPIFVVLTLLFGGFVGIASGLIGVGGGVLMVPFLYFLFEHPSASGATLPGGLDAVVAHATSLLVIIPTAVSGLHSYQRAGLVAWRVVVPMAAGAVLSATLGAHTALSIQPALLKAGFGALLLMAGIRLVRRPRAPADGGRGAHRFPWFGSFLAGGVVGFFSALMGVGGGIVAIPILIYLVGVDVKKVAATSIGIVVFAATAGVIAYSVSGRGVEGLPPLSLGYVFTPAALALMPGAVLGARFGARLNQRLKVDTLRWVFAVVFLVLGARLLFLNGRLLFD